MPLVIDDFSFEVVSVKTGGREVLMFSAKTVKSMSDFRCQSSCIISYGVVSIVIAVVD